MNIILLGPREPIPPTRGGAIEKLTYGLARSLASKGQNVTVISTCEGGYGTNEVNDVKIICLSRPIPGKIYSKEMLDFSRKAHRVLERALAELTSNDAIVHSVYFYNLISFPSFNKIPIVITEFEHYPWIPEYLYHYPFISTYRRIRWEADSRIRKMLAKIIAPRASKIVFISRFQCQQFLKNVKIPEFKCTIIPNAVDINSYRPMNVHGLRDEIADGAEVVLLFVGRLTPHKGLHFLLKAIAKLTPSYRKRIKLVVIGPRAPGFRPDPKTSLKLDKYVAYIDFLIRQHELDNIVRFLGQVHESELPLYYNAVDMLVHPSLVEAFGLVIIEAMACGKPVLALRIPPLNEIIADGETGILADHTPRSLAEKLSYVVDNIGEVRKMGIRGRRVVEERYSWDVISDKYLRLYDTLLSRRK